MNIKDYIKQHNDTHYCEAIIYPNGDIEDAIRGHTYKLMSATEKSKEEINKIIPRNASPLHWLVCYTKCVSVWHEFFLYNNMTDEQRNTIQQLVNHNILDSVVTGYYTDELERCELLDKFYKGEITELNLPEKLKNIYVWRE